MKRLVLIDGHAILHRAYHALPKTLTTSEGQTVNAVYGFVRMLLKVIQDLGPTHLAVCFDRPEPTFRKKLFKDYQAQRPEMEEELVSQVDLVKKVIKAMGVPIYEKAGYEGDDIIGTLASQAAEVAHENSLVRGPLADSLIANSKNFVGSPPPAFETIVVTGDKDILQLVDKNIRLYMPVRGLSQAKLYGVKEVEKKFGIRPEQIVDFKALVGDPSDNYPGVKGIGPKTAVKLLKHFNSLEKIYDKKQHVLEFVNKRVFRALKRDKEQAELAKKLAKIVTDVPVKLDFKKAQLGKLDKPEVKKLFEELEFKSLIPRLSEDKTKRKIAKQGRLKKNEETEKSEQLTLV